MAVTAPWNRTVAARSAATIQVEGNHYVPPDAVEWDHLLPSTGTSRCWWKGSAVYWAVAADGSVAPSAAWACPDPTPDAARIRGHVAFWRGVVVGEET